MIPTILRIHLLACAWGSMKRGHRLEFITRTAFSMDHPWANHSCANFLSLFDCRELISGCSLGYEEHLYRERCTKSPGDFGDKYPWSIRIRYAIAPANEMEASDTGIMWNQSCSAAEIDKATTDTRLSCCMKLCQTPVNQTVNNRHQWTVRRYCVISNWTNCKIGENTSEIFVNISQHYNTINNVFRCKKNNCYYLKLEISLQLEINNKNIFINMLLMPLFCIFKNVYYICSWYKVKYKNIIA